MRDQLHKIVREVACGECSAVYTQQINWAGIPDLLIVAWDGSNLYCGHTTYIFSQNGGIQNVAIITGGEGHFQRLGRYGLQFVMKQSGVLEYACDVCHACEPNLPVVLDWNDGRTVNATARYPSLTKAAAATYRRDFSDACAALEASASGQSVISPAAGYYANEYELGHGRVTYRRIMNRLPTKRTRQWFRYCAKVVRYQIAQIRYMNTVSQSKVLTTSRSNVFQHPPRYPKMESLSE